jgi:tetratricopeptide (TPR) repeat protein
MQLTRKTLESFLRDDPNLGRGNLAEWSFDVDRIPQETRASLEQQHRVSLLGMQDWYAAADHASRVTKLAPELAWAWDIVGYAAERRGDIDAAKEAYLQASECSVFTDQSIRLETHWTTDQSAKFSVARLLDLDPDLIAQSPYLSALCDADPKRRRGQGTAYWIQRGSEFDASGDLKEAHRCFTAAGWDVGAESMGVYAELLERISAIAIRLDQPGRAETAMTHRRCLRDRYGV